MLTISITANPPSAAQVTAAKNALRVRERTVAWLIALVSFALVVLYPIVISAIDVEMVSYSLAWPLGYTFLMLCVLLWRVGAIGSQMASLMPANAIELIQLPDFIQASTVVRDYVARVGALQRPLLAAEFNALALQAQSHGKAPASAHF